MPKRLPALSRSRLSAPLRGAPLRRAAAGDAWSEPVRAVRRWAAVGAVLGALLSLVVCAPAAWLAGWVASASGERVLLADARGTIWNGDAVLVLGGGRDSRDASTLPGRLSWTLRPAGGPALRLALRQACCIRQEVALRISPGLGRVVATLEPGSSSGSGSETWMAQWPAALLSGLGTPWNTLQPLGALRLTSPGLTLTWAQGRFALQGSAAVELRDFSSRLSTLPRLGSYRLDISSDPASAGTAQIQLSTLDGALRLSGQGSWSASGLRLRGEASAAEADQAALNNLLNIIGRRNGAGSVLTIG